MDILIVYGSTYGNTEDAAYRLAASFKGVRGARLAVLGRPGVRTRVMDVAQLRAADLTDIDLVVLGASTWDFGELQADWDARLDEIAGFDWDGRRVALFGQGDQVIYEDTYLDALGTIAGRLEARGAQLYGAWPAEGYACSASLALRGDRFVGLALDEDNEGDKTEARVEAWVDQLAEALTRERLDTPPPGTAAPAETVATEDNLVPAEPVSVHPSLRWRVGSC